MASSHNVGAFEETERFKIGQQAEELVKRLLEATGHRFTETRHASDEGAPEYIHAGGNNTLEDFMIHEFPRHVDLPTPTGAEVKHSSSQEAYCGKQRYSISKRSWEQYNQVADYHPVLIVVVDQDSGRIRYARVSEIEPADDYKDMYWFNVEDFDPVLWFAESRDSVDSTEA